MKNIKQNKTTMSLLKEIFELDEKVKEFLLDYFKWPGYGMENNPAYKDWDEERSERCVFVQINEEWEYLFNETQIRLVDCRNWSYTQKGIYGPAYYESLQRWDEFLKDFHVKLLKPFYMKCMKKSQSLIMIGVNNLKKQDVPAESVYLPRSLLNIINIKDVGNDKEFPEYHTHYLGMELRENDEDDEDTIIIKSPREYGRFQEIKII